MKVRVEGVKEAQQAIDEAGERIAAALQIVADAAAEAVLDDARRTVPVDRGNLRDALIKTGDAGDYEVRVFTPEARYGHYVEFGTSKQPAQPFMGPAAERERKNMPKRVESAVKEATGG